MDKDRDRDTGRVGSKEELRRHMDETRRSMSETVGEIKSELSSALDWRTYVRRYPEAYLVGGVLLGVVVGRMVKGRTLPEEPRYRPLPARRAEVEEFTPAPAAAPKPDEDSPLRRMGEMLATAVIAQVAPVLSSALRRALGFSSMPSEEPPAETRKPWLH